MVTSDWLWAWFFVWSHKLVAKKAVQQMKRPGLGIVCNQRQEDSRRRSVLTYTRDPTGLLDPRNRCGLSMACGRECGDDRPPDPWIPRILTPRNPAEISGRDTVPFIIVLSLSGSPPCTGCGKRELLARNKMVSSRHIKKFILPCVFFLHLFPSQSHPLDPQMLLLRSTRYWPDNLVSPLACSFPPTCSGSVLLSNSECPQRQSTRFAHNPIITLAWLNLDPRSVPSHRHCE